MVELGAYFFDGTAERINNFFGEDCIKKRVVVMIKNKKGDKCVELVLHNPDSDYDYEVKTIENGKDFSYGKMKLRKQKNERKKNEMGR